MKFQGFIGAAYKLDSVNVDAQRCVNMYPEIIESGLGKGGQVAYLTTTPGLEKFCEVGTGPIRLVHIDYIGRTWVVSGNGLFFLTYENDEVVVNELGDAFNSSAVELGTSTGRVKAASMSSNGFYSSNGLVSSTLFVDGDTSWVFFDGANLAASFGELDNFYNAIDKADEVVWIDGFFIVNERGTNQFWVSDRGGFDFDGLSFDSTEGSPDIIVGLLVNNRLLWIFNEQSSEIYAWTGNADFPFERVQGGFVEIGCLARNSIAKIDSTVFWLGRSKEGQGQIYSASGMVPQRVSTHAIERAIAKYENVASATAWTYESKGHKFYVLNFDEATWAYDLSTGLWHERAFTNGGQLERHRAEIHAFHPGVFIDNGSPFEPFKLPFAAHIVSDHESNALYFLKDDVFTDDGSEITRLRTAPHVSGELKKITYWKLQIDMETGVGLDGDVQGSDPQVMLDWSDDGGHTWSSEQWASIGKKIGGIGDFKKRVSWRRLGSSRDRIFRVKMTDPVKANWIDAFIEVEGGDS